MKLAACLGARSVTSTEVLSSAAISAGGGRFGSSVLSGLTDNAGCSPGAVRRESEKGKIKRLFERSL